MSQRWFIVIAAILFAAAVGFMAYNAGLQHGIAQNAKIVVPPGSAAYPYPYPYAYPYYGWHPGFFFFPFLLLFFFFFIARGLFWRGRWHGRHCGYYRGDEPDPERLNHNVSV